VDEWVDRDAPTRPGWSDDDGGPDGADERDDDAGIAPGGAGVGERGQVLADWSREEDDVVAALLLHLLTEAKPASEDLAVVHHTLDAWHRELGEAAEAAGIPDPWAAADLIYLVSRGAMLSTLEHQGTWTAERLTTAAGNLTRLLRPGRSGGY
jgi:hypothetical protein